MKAGHNTTTLLEKIIYMKYIYLKLSITKKNNAKFEGVKSTVSLKNFRLFFIDTNFSKGIYSA